MNNQHRGHCRHESDFWEEEHKPSLLEWAKMVLGAFTTIVIAQHIMWMLYS